MSVDIRKMIDKVNNFKQFVNENVGENIIITEKEIDTIFNNVKNYLFENNKTENHYHNNHHILDVFNNSMVLFKEYEKEYSLDHNDKLHLGLAALFHDYNHTGGKMKDDENIKIALDGLNNYLDLINKPSIFNDIKKIIIVTEFPHKDIDLDILQKIIRDADTMGGISDGWISVVKSLAKEYNKSLTDFIPIQIKFIENTKFNTGFCEKLLENNKEEIVVKLKNML